MLNEQLYSQMMAMMCEIYEKQPTKALMESYYFVLKDMDNDNFKGAVAGLLKEREYSSMPKPGEIIAYAKKQGDFAMYHRVFKKMGYSDEQIEQDLYGGGMTDIRPANKQIKDQK